MVGSPEGMRDMNLTVAEIQETVCAEFGIELADLLSDRRSVAIVRPRQIAMWLARQLTPKSIPMIGRCFNRDHTTVLHAVETVERRIFESDVWGRTAIALKRRLCADERQMELGSV